MQPLNNHARYIVFLDCLAMMLDKFSKPPKWWCKMVMYHGTIRNKNYTKKQIQVFTLTPHQQIAAPILLMEEIRLASW